MKKTLIALAVAGVSSVTQAAEIYSLDGVTVDLSGEVDVQYYKSQDKSQHSEWNVNEAKFGFDMTYEMTEDLAVGSHMDVNANDEEDNGSVSRGDVYGKIVYLQSHTISFGSQPTILDDSGIGDDYEFGFTSFVDSANNEGDQVIKYKYDGGEMFYGGLAYLENQNNNSSTSSDDDYQIDGDLGARIDDFDITVFLAHAQNNGIDVSTYDLEIRYLYGDWQFATTYGESSTEQEGASDRDKSTYGLTASYNDGGRFEYAAGWAVVETNHSISSAVPNGDVNDFYFNVTYSLSNEVAIYAEVGLTDNNDEETGYVIGLDTTF
ncbi:porin [Vibrio mangrovi]|uniref:Porin n=1 Tax=Vibrio mangrovi TaxID=474394 RepID=A0A1Y6IUL4_9VIBR|nr:porin [Vibrio mangrovi]MDW6003102.1 porin [Vibrio mangrovi]SMS01344.1 Porin-like protein H precursor [Vibrio mangrovi]